MLNALRAGFAGLFLVLLVSCAGMEAHHETLIRTGVTYATLKVVKDGARAERVVEVANLAADLVEGDAVAAVAELEQVVREKIDFRKLSMEDALLVGALITTIRIELERVLEGREITAERKVAVVTILRWVAEAAALRT